jgi:hypothetical protein
MITEFGLTNNFYRNNVYNTSIQESIRKNLDEFRSPISCDDVVDVHNYLEMFGNDSGKFLQELGKPVDSYQRLIEKDLRKNLDLLEMSPQVRRCKELFVSRL